MSIKLYVGNLPFSATNQDLEGLFAQSGQVESANVITDRDTGRSRGFGFVEMESREGADAAIQQLNGYELDGEQSSSMKLVHVRTAAAVADLAAAAAAALAAAVVVVVVVATAAAAAVAVVPAAVATAAVDAAETAGKQQRTRCERKVLSAECWVLS